jgi:hypothetical protein
MIISNLSHIDFSVSVQTVTQTVNALAAGLVKVCQEVEELKLLRACPPEDQFIDVMQVIHGQNCDSSRSRCLRFVVGLCRSSECKCRCVEENGSFS